MRYVLVLLLTCIVGSISAQQIDYSILSGKWLCYKATQGKTDLTYMYKDHYVIFKSDSLYSEERQYSNNTTMGIYTLDKKSGKLSFRDLVSRTKYPNAKVKMEDLVMKAFRHDEFIISLDKKKLVVVIKKRPDTEILEDLTLFYKRQNE